MGDANQLTFLKRHVPSVAGPVLEIGSKDYGNTQDFRAVYSGNEYVGLDMEQGPGVDIVHDLTTGVGPLRPDHFELAICCSVLEHVRRPWVFAEHLSGVIQNGGILYLAVPWVWRFHAFPDDYFRFSWRGIEELFPEFEWHHRTYSTTIIGEFVPATENADNDFALFVKKPSGNRKYLPHLMLHVIGYKGRQQNCA